MNRIKTREKVKDIKLLDRSAIAGRRMKDAYIRTRKQLPERKEEQQHTPSDYAGDMVQDVAEDIFSYAGHKAVSGTKQATQYAAKTAQQQRTKKDALMQRGRAPAAYGKPDPITSLQRSGETMPTSHTPTERGRSYAKKQAVQRAAAKQTLYTDSNKLNVQPARPLIKTREHVEEAPQQFGSTMDTAKPHTVRQQASKTVRRRTDRAVKTAQRTRRTARMTVKTASKARAAAQTAKKSRRHIVAAARTARRTVQTARRAVKATLAALKAILAAAKALIAAIAAGGWVAVLIIVIICLIGLFVASPYGIFFSGEDSGTGLTIRDAVQTVNQEYTDRIEEIKRTHPCDVLTMSGSCAPWPEVLAVYAVKTATDPEHGQEVATVDDAHIALLSEVFWRMHEVTFRVNVVTHTEVNEDGSTSTTETVYLYITTSHKIAEEMAKELHFNEEQRELLTELLNAEQTGLWNDVLYGAGSGSIVEAACSQIGNVGGQPYWSWYGFDNRVDWCACFVSWCADRCGYIDAGIIPKFASCSAGAQWFKARGQWQENTYVPSPGDLIFFDWDTEGTGQNGAMDHVGIVERVEGGVIYTIEGNSGDACRRRSYPVGHYEIFGFAVPAYR